MKPLPGDARRLLDAARSGAAPSAAERARADAAARTRLAHHGIDDLPALAPSAASSSVGSGGTTASAALKVGAAVLIIGAALVISVGNVRPSATPAVQRPAAAASAPIALAAAAPAPAAAPVMEATAPSPAGDTSLSPRAPARANASDEALRAELNLIGQANDLVRDDRFDEALRVLARHRQRFPAGVLRMEREGLRVLSLCGMGDGERAQRARDRYLQTAPRSPLATRVRAACDSADAR